MLQSIVAGGHKRPARALLRGVGGASGGGDLDETLVDGQAVPN